MPGVIGPCCVALPRLGAGPAAGRRQVRVCAAKRKPPPPPPPPPAPQKQEQPADEGEDEGEGEYDEWAEGEEGEYYSEEGEEEEAAEQEEEGEEEDAEDEEEMEAIDLVNSYYSIPGMIHILPGENGLPRIFLKHPWCESAAEIYLHGATITQWLRPDGNDALAARPDADYSGTGPIDSGIKLFFPQYRSGGFLDQGFANSMPWEIIAAGLDFLPFGDGFRVRHAPEEDYERAEAAAIKDIEDLKTKIKEEKWLGEEEEAEKGEGEGEAEGEVSTSVEAVIKEDDPETYPWRKKGRKGRGQGEGGAAAGEGKQVAGAGEGTQAAAGGEGVGQGKGEEEEAEEGEEEDGMEDAAYGVYDQEEGAEGEEGEEEEEEEGEEELHPYLGRLRSHMPGLDEPTRLIKKYMDAGLDPAPYVTLRLRDTPETRERWPHKFELLYKITLMEEDDFSDPTPGPDTETFSLETSGTLIAQAMADKERDIRLAQMGHQAGGQEEGAGGLRTDYRLHPSMVDKEEPFSVAVDEQPQAVDPAVEEERAAERQRRKGQRGRQGQQEEDKSEEVPMQLRMEVIVVNKDDEGSEPMTFQVGHLAHIATSDQTQRGDFIKIRGLGGSNVVDYSDERVPQLGLCEEDYVNFWGQRIDATFVNAADADVAMCPGDSTHFELKQGVGYRDVMVYHPGTLDDAVKEDTDAARFWAGLGTGRVMTPLTLQPGQEWYGSFALRFHNRYWKAPVFGETGMHPLGGIPKSMMENADDGAVDDDVEGTAGMQAEEEAVS